VELEFRHIQMPVTIRNRSVEPSHEPDDLLAVQLSTRLVQVGDIGRIAGLPFVEPALETPYVGPLRARRVVGAKEVERRRNPLVEVALDNLRWNPARFHDPEQAVVPGAQVEALLLEHRSHGTGQRMESGRGQHLELELPIPVDVLGIGKEVQPVLYDFIEGTEQTLALLGPSLEKLLGLPFPLVPEVLAQQVRHLPAMPHLLA